MSNQGNRPTTRPADALGRQNVWSKCPDAEDLSVHVRPSVRLPDDGDSRVLRWTWRGVDRRRPLEVVRLASDQ